MKLGIAGLPRSGKTTIFSALSRIPATTAQMQKKERSCAVITVSDSRIDRLSDIYSPKKTTYATVEIVDFAGFTELSAGQKAGLSTEYLGQLRAMDALAAVVRNFSDDITGKPTPTTDISTVIDEFIIADLISVENRLERIGWAKQRGKGTPAAEKEELLLKRITEHLSEKKALDSLSIAPDEKPLIDGFQFLTSKPLLIILNSADSTFGGNQEIIELLGDRFSVIECAGQFEEELALLDDEEKALFMADMGISASARDRLTCALYETAGYISFITVGPDEVRAWPVRRGTIAVGAAGAIHTDLAHRFIRAECCSFTDLITLGSEKAVRDNGRLRLEGKEYIVRDGDILNIRASR
ncbi:MAG: redox-regulated ATPase YchF [Deltaproteobacteria bacterium]|nr:redox-regulated ATPase YchF [Deltaproteobacteria bacterium]